MNEKETKLAERVAKVLGKDVERVKRMSLVGIIEDLLEEIECGISDTE